MHSVRSEELIDPDMAHVCHIIVRHASPMGQTNPTRRMGKVGIDAVSRWERASRTKHGPHLSFPEETRMTAE